MNSRMTKADFLAAIRKHAMAITDRHDGMIGLRFHTMDDVIGNTNVNYLAANYGGIVQLKRLYGGTDIWIDPAELYKVSKRYPALLEDMDRAYGYMVLDDDSYEALRNDEQLEAWQDYLLDDVKSGIVEAVNGGGQLICDTDGFFDWLTNDDDLMWLYGEAWIDADGGGYYLANRDDVVKSGYTEFWRRIGESEADDLTWMCED